MLAVVLYLVSNFQIAKICDRGVFGKALKGLVLGGPLFTGQIYRERPEVIDQLQSITWGTSERL